MIFTLVPMLMCVFSQIIRLNLRGDPVPPAEFPLRPWHVIVGSILLTSILTAFGVAIIRRQQTFDSPPSLPTELRTPNGATLPVRLNPADDQQSDTSRPSE
jgi:hypothetical protein